MTPPDSFNTRALPPLLRHRFGSVLPFSQGQEPLSTRTHQTKCSWRRSAFRTASQSACGSPQSYIPGNRQSLWVEPGLLPKLHCMLRGFLLFAMMLVLLVNGCVSPSTFYVITNIFTVITMIWVADLGVFSGVGAGPRNSASSVNWYQFLEEDSWFSGGRGYV